MIDKLASIRFELRQHEFFENVSEDGLNDLVELCQVKVCKPRSPIFAQGDDADSLYIILSGCVKIFTLSTGGKETVLTFMGPGEVLGEIAVLDGGVRTAGATPIEETRVVMLSQGRFLKYLETHPLVSLEIIRVLCARLRRTDQFVEEMTTLQAAPRLAKALLRIADQYGKDEADGSVHLSIKVSQANLGAHAGLMRENVNRQLKLWEEEGILISKAGAITLLNPEALEEAARQVS